MDKVVQEVAATAEESASAAEEMNAQAFQTGHIAGDMIALVGAGEKGDVKDMATVASFDARLDQTEGSASMNRRNLNENFDLFS